MLFHLFISWCPLIYHLIIINEIFNCIRVRKNFLLRFLFIPKVLQLFSIWIFASVRFFILLNHFINFQLIICVKIILYIEIWLKFLSVRISSKFTVKFFSHFLNLTLRYDILFFIGTKKASQFFSIWILAEFLFIFFHHLFNFIGWYKIILLLRVIKFF